MTEFEGEPPEQWVETGDEYVEDPATPGELWPQTQEHYTEGHVEPEDL